MGEYRQQMELLTYFEKVRKTKTKIREDDRGFSIEIRWTHWFRVNKRWLSFHNSVHEGCKDKQKLTKEQLRKEEKKNWNHTF